MKNLITAIRLNDNKTRIFELPETIADESIKAGTLLNVEYGSEYVTTLCIAKDTNHLLDDSHIKTLMDFMHIKGDFRKVKEIYDAPKAVEWPTEAADDTEEADEAEAETEGGDE